MLVLLLPALVHWCVDITTKSILGVVVWWHYAGILDGRYRYISGNNLERRNPLKQRKPFPKVYLPFMSTSLYICFIYDSICVVYAPSYISVISSVCNRHVFFPTHKPHPSSIPTTFQRRSVVLAPSTPLDS